MAYDRYDRRDYDRDRGGRDDRGFFERAGDEIASWFGDDEADRRRRYDEQMNRDNDRYNSAGWSDRDREMGSGWGRDRDYDRGYGRDYDRDRYAYRGTSRDYGRNRDYDRDRSGARPLNWTSSERDYRSGSSDRSARSGYGGYDRDFSSRGGLGGSSSDYRSSTGPSYGYGSRYGAGSSSGYGSGGFANNYADERDRSYDRSDTEWGRDDYRRTSYAGSTRDNDRHYHAWRQRQLDDLDRDYDQYCRERQDRFESDFGSWRENRMSKRQQMSGIREHMDVVGSDGESVGKVDKVRGDRIILTKSDSDDNRHHSLDCSMIETIEGDQVRLSVPAEEAKSRFRDSEDRGLFGRDDDEDTNLERSFSGTYSS